MYAWIVLREEISVEVGDRGNGFSVLWRGE